MVEYQTIKDDTSCPHCNTFVNGLDQTLQYFGLRNMGDGTTRVQSWCKKCRNQSRKEVIL